MTHAVAVMVLNHNGRQHLGRCFDSLGDQSYLDCELYLVDNNSTDGSVQYVKNNFPHVRIIGLKKNYGFAEAYNKAIRLVDSEYVGILNNDTETDRNWLAELVKAMLSDQRIAASGSKILLFSEKDILNHAGGMITIIGGGYDIGYMLRDSEYYNHPKQVGYVCGASMLVRRKTFLEIGGFDDDFFGYAEDVDFCWRAWLYGFRVVYVPSSVVYHKLGGTAGSRSSPLRIYLAERNRNLTVVKNLQQKALVRAFLLTPFYSLARMLASLARKNYYGAFAIVRADLHFLKVFDRAWAKRLIVQKNRVVSDRHLESKYLVAPLSISVMEFLRLIRGSAV